MRKLTSTLLLAVGMLALPEAASAQMPPAGKDPGERWFQATPYLWFASIQGDNSIGPVTVPIDVNFGDIWSNLKFAFEGHFEAGKNHGIGGVDFTYIRLGQDSIPIDTPGPVQPFADYRFTLVQAELFGAYRVDPTAKTKFDLLGGARINSQMQEFSIVSGPGEGADVSETWADFFAGFRVFSTLGRRWNVGLRGDAGAGGSKFTANGGAGIGFQVSKLVSLETAFRYLYINFATGEPDSLGYYAYKADQFGLVLGVGFHF